MTNQAWFVDLDLKLQAEPSDELVDELIDAVDPLNGTLAVGPGPALGVSLVVDAASAWQVAETVRAFLEKDLAQLVPGPEVTSLRILDEATRTAENEAPRFPELAAVPDIADMLGVSRQQAHRLTNREGFPTPALTPRTGPLWVRAAVEAWNERTERHKGRPAKAAVEASVTETEDIYESLEALKEQLDDTAQSASKKATSGSASQAEPSDIPWG